MLRKQLTQHQDVGFVDMLVKVVEMAAYVTEDVQNQVEFVGKVTADLMAVCVLKEAGQEQVGVQQVLHVDVASQQTTGVILVIQVTADQYVMLVTTVGKTKHMVVIQTAQV